MFLRIFTEIQLGLSCNRIKQYNQICLSICDILDHFNSNSRNNTIPTKSSINVTIVNNTKEYVTETLPKFLKAPKSIHFEPMFFR